MQLPHYRYRTNESFLDYEFTSEGSQGLVKKVVRYTKIHEDVFNLGFGDLDEETGEISDTIVTNNEDTNKVLTTVAATAIDFTNTYPDVWVVAKGTTHSRTRLYRRGITNNWQDISSMFEVYGLLNGDWELFEQRKDYEAFLIRRK